MGDASAALQLLLAIVIILGVAWAINYVLATFTSLPAVVQQFVWLVAAIIVILKLVQFAAVV